jgi:hypothetical protein
VHARAARAFIYIMQRTSTPAGMLLLLLGLLTAGRSNTCNQLADQQYVRCSENPLHRAGQFHSDEKVYEISIGDPDVQYDDVSHQWHAWWSTGLAPSYTANQTMGIKHAVSADGVKFVPTLAPVLRTAKSPTAWDHSKAETPTVVRLPPAMRTPERQWLMLYSGGNDGAPRPAGITYTWYQIGAAFSADGENFTKISATESPYANKTTPYGSGSLEGLVLLGRDAFPGVAGIAEGLVADPELVVDSDGETLHLYMSSEAIDSRGTPLKYGVSHATSRDGVHWVPSAGNPVRASWPTTLTIVALADLTCARI